jgi:hypothetical protein
MKVSTRLLAVLATCALAAPFASATFVGNLQTSAGNGGVTVTDSTIMFIPQTSSNLCPTVNTCDFSVSPGGVNSYGPGGSLTVNTSDNGTIGNLTVNQLPPNPFLVIYNAAGTPQIDFSLTNVADPTPTDGTNCAGISNPADVGHSCVAFIGSPFLITTLLNPDNSIGSSISITLSGVANDLIGGGMSNYHGSLSQNITFDSPGMVQSTFCGTQTNFSTPCSTNGSITTGHTGSFTASAVPEPTSAFLGLSGLLMVAGLYRRRRK